MARISQRTPPVKSPATNFPEKLRVVRSANARSSGIYSHSSAFTIDGNGLGASRIRSRFDRQRRGAF